MCYSRGMTARRYVPVRLSEPGYKQIKQWADEQTSGNTSEMVRILLAEAVAARQAKEQKR